MWWIGPYRFDPERRLLTSDAGSTHLTPRTADLLRVLVEAGGEVVTKEEIFRTVWSGCAIEEGNLTQQISTLRRALGRAAAGHSYIETIPKTGYRLSVPGRRITAGPSGRFDPWRLLAIAAACAGLAMWSLLFYQLGAWHQHSERPLVRSVAIGVLPDTPSLPASVARRAITSGLESVSIPVLPADSPSPAAASIEVTRDRGYWHFRLQAPNRAEPLWQRRIAPEELTPERLRRLFAEAFRNK